MNNIQGKTQTVQLKKAFTTLSQAYTMAKQENGTPDSWGLTAGTGAGAKVMMDTIKPYLSLLKDCGTGGDCFGGAVYSQMNKADMGNFDNYNYMSRLQLSDGTPMAAYVTNASCTDSFGSSTALQNICGYIFVDVNATKKPNQVGKDFFLFWVTKEGIVPTGTADDTAFPFPGQCNFAMSGWGCTAWVIYNENEDYLNCSGLSWNGPLKCN